MEPRFHKGAIISSCGFPEPPPTEDIGADQQFTVPSRSLIHAIVIVEGPECVLNGRGGAGIPRRQESENTMLPPYWSIGRGRGLRRAATKIKPTLALLHPTKPIAFDPTAGLHPKRSAPPCQTRPSVC